MTDFATSVERLLRQVRHWEQGRWAASGQAERVRAVIQLLADLGADAEGVGRRAVPREHDMVLPDQLRVVADDLLLVSPGDRVLAAAGEAVEGLRGGLETGGR